MMTTNPSAIDRIPLAHSVHYVARGLPEVPNQYGPGVLAPSEITLTYRAAPDSQLGRVHAYVAGRIWVDGKELPLLPGGLYGQHYLDVLDNWPAWLAEEARLHDPERTAPAGLGVSATPSHTDLRQRIAAAVRRQAETGNVRYEALADAVLAELPPPADEAAVLRKLADQQTQLAVADDLARRRNIATARRQLVKELRRLADEAQQQPTDRDVVEAHDAALSFTLKADAAPQPEPPVHGESVAHLAGLHDDEPTVDARQDGAQS